MKKLIKKNRTEYFCYFHKTFKIIRNICFFIFAISLICLNVFAYDAEKVSIIIPVYNVEKYIKECLDSVVNQTYKNLEIICVDDCGVDNSVKIAEGYAQKDNRVRIVHHDKNMGAGVARNTGIKNSNGEYIFFLDSDDYLNLDIIELMVKKQKETTADVVVSNIRVFSLDKDEIIRDRLKANRELLKFIPKDYYKIDINNFSNNLNNIFCVCWGKLYKKGFLIKNNIWYTSENICYEDGGFCLKVLSNFPLVSFMGNVGVNYRINPYSVTYKISAWKHQINAKAMLKDFFQYLDNQFEKDVAEKLKKLTKTSPRYEELYTISIFQLFIYWLADVLKQK